MSVTARVSNTVIMAVGQTKVKRYWRGKAPEWADDNAEDADTRMGWSAALEKAFPASCDRVLRTDDSRLRRLAESRIDNRDEVMEDRKRIRQAETEEEETRRQERLEMEVDDEDAVEERRRTVREKMKQSQAAFLPQEEEEEVEEEESEYETDSEEGMTGIAMVMPVFFPKSERYTIAKQDKPEALEVYVKKRTEEMRKETKDLVVEKIREDHEIHKNMELEKDNTDVDTDDDVNEVDEYAAWKVREIARIKRDRDDRGATLKDKEKIEKVVTNMTEEERKNPKPVASNKRQRRFMQKYYHKGAFFQSNPDDDSAGTSGPDGIYVRDFSAPTGEDKLDKTILPKVMQVKHFGRSGRTKWTHLVNEDTTDWNNPWTYNDPLRAKYNLKMAGINAPIAKPRGISSRS